MVCVSLHRPGSVIADYTISATSNNLDFGAANTQVFDSLKAKGINLVENAFAQSGKCSQCLIINPSHFLISSYLLFYFLDFACCWVI